MRRAIFLDRDGVINMKAADGDYVRSWDDFRFLPNSLEGLRTLGTTDYLIVVVTNQRGVGRGLMTRTDLNLIHLRMCMEVKKAGARIDKIYFCPHDIGAGCECRKPGTGMLRMAEKDLGVDLAGSILLGDSEVDIEAGRRAGCSESILLDATRTALAARPDRVFGDLLEAARYISGKAARNA